MKALRLTDEWTLTTECPASSHGEPRLVHSGDGKAYGWGDILSHSQESHCFSALEAVDGLIWGQQLSGKELDILLKFHLVL